MFSTKYIIQRFKGVMEGNSSLETNVKYAGNKKLYRRPFVVTMNGDSIRDICIYFPEELEAINVRCHIFYLDTPLKRLAPAEVLKYVFVRRALALCYLRRKFDKYYKSNMYNKQSIID